MDWPLVAGAAVAAATVGVLVWQREPLLAIASRSATYLREVRAEVRKVTWVSWPDLKNMTVVIIILVFICGVVIGLMDQAFTLLLIKWFSSVFG